MRDVLARIAEGLEAAAEVAARFVPGRVEWSDKGGGDPVTEADRCLNETLRALLPRPGEGWLSEETADDASRLSCSRVWVVDPLDGTREFVAGLPEWCVSIGLVEDGRAVAGGVLNPATGERFLGAVGHGISRDGEPARVSGRRSLDGALVLASRSEVGRGEWDRFRSRPFTTRAMGSVAYKLALVAAGRADATWTLVPKHEWDVAAGVALVTAAGGEAVTLAGEPPRFNRPRPLFEGLLAHPPGLAAEVRAATGVVEAPPQSAAAAT